MQIPESCQRAEKVVEYEGDGDINYSWCLGNSSQRTELETGRTRD